MTKLEKQRIINAECIAYYSGYNGIEIKEIINGYNDYIIFCSNCWCNRSAMNAHKAVIKYTLSGNPYFMYNGHRIPLDDCIRNGI